MSKTTLAGCAEIGEGDGDANGTPDGVDGVAVAVVCGDKAAAQTDVVPLSKEGEAKVSVSRASAQSR